MAVYKDGDKWRVIYRYTNYKGERKQTQKRGFATKREAVAWEHEVMLKSDSKLDMTFASFFEIYEEDKKKRVKENTWESKSHVIRTKILPYFGERKIAEIEPKDVIAWQNELLAYKGGENGKVFSPTYLKYKCQYKNVVFLSYKNVEKPTRLYDIFCILIFLNHVLHLIL